MNAGFTFTALTAALVVNYLTLTSVSFSAVVVRRFAPLPGPILLARSRIGGFLAPALFSVGRSIAPFLFSFLAHHCLYHLCLTLSVYNI